jgi:hypothetical protein
MRLGSACTEHRRDAARCGARSGRHGLGPGARGLAALGCALVLVLLAWAPPGLGQVETGRAESQQWRIRISAPEDWRISAQGSYPRVVAWMYRSNPAGTMLLTAERAKAIASSVQYAQATAAQLRALGYTVATEPQMHAATQAFWIEFDDGKTFFRQAFWVVEDTAYALTLSAPERRARAQHLRAFDSALRSMERIDEVAGDTAATQAPTADQDVSCTTPAPQP